MKNFASARVIGLLNPTYVEGLWLPSPLSSRLPLSLISSRSSRPLTATARTHVIRPSSTLLQTTEAKRNQIILIFTDQSLPFIIFSNMYKLTTLIALLSATSTSAFVAPAATNKQAATQLSANNNVNFDKITNAATVAAASVLATPFAALAAEADDEYVYGAVAAPGGLGLAAGLGVLAILTAAVPVLLAPGEDAFNEMKDRDANKWRK